MLRGAVSPTFVSRLLPSALPASTPLAERMAVARQPSPRSSWLSWQLCSPQPTCYVDDDWRRVCSCGGSSCYCDSSSPQWGATSLEVFSSRFPAVYYFPSGIQIFPSRSAFLLLSLCGVFSQQLPVSRGCVSFSFAHFLCSSLPRLLLERALQVWLVPQRPIALLLTSRPSRWPRLL